MVAQSINNALVQCYSLQRVQVTFAHQAVNLVRYLPPLVDPASNEIDDVYAWLHILPVEPGWLLRDTLWVCASADQAVSLARLRARALRHTNMGDLYAPPAWFTVRDIEVEPQAASEQPRPEFEQLLVGAMAHGVASFARRFVCCNVMMECAPHPRDAANQARTDHLKALLRSMAS